MDDHPTLMIDGADAAVVGYHMRCGEPMVVVYDHEKLVQHFVEQGCSVEDAIEHISVNIEGAYLGKGTVAVLNRMSADEIRELIQQ